MIGHIFKKDLRRLWPFVIGITVADFAFAIGQIAFGQFPNDNKVLRELSQFWDLASVGTILLVIFVAVMTVQLDPIPGDRQDWLVRPIKRWDMLLAKVLFVTVLIHGPMLAADIFQGLATGFPLGQTLTAALSRNIYQFVTLSLPAMAIGALTRSVGQMLGLGLAVVAGAYAVAGAVLVICVFAQSQSVMDNGHSLTSFILKTVFILVGAVAVLHLQYFRRATTRGRVVFAIAAVLGVGAYILLPQGPAFALQGWVSGAPGRAVSITFAPDAARPPRVRKEENEAGLLGRLGTEVYLPLRVEGFPRWLILASHTLRATFTATDGTRVTVGSDQGSPLHLPGQPDATTYYQEMRVPTDFFRAHADQSVSVKIDFVLSILRPHGSYELPATAGEIRIPEVGWCATEINQIDTAVKFRCLNAGEVRVRVSASLVDRASGRRNPSLVQYEPNEAPYRSGVDMIARIGSNLQFRDPDIDARYPVGSSQLPMSVVVVSVSQPLAHVVRQITIPNLRLSEWKAEVAVSSP